MRRGGAVKLKECRASVRDKRIIFIRLDFVQGAFVSGRVGALSSSSSSSSGVAVVVSSSG